MTDDESMALALRIMDRIERDRAIHLSSLVEEIRIAVRMANEPEPEPLKPPFVSAGDVWAEYIAKHAMGMRTVLDGPSIRELLGDAFPMDFGDRL